MEFRKMRRAGQLLEGKECIAILERNTAGVLSLLGDGGYPYGVPLSYVWQDGAVYFHCAKEGHKLDAIQNSPKASFCVIDQDQVVPEKYTTFFRSVIAFGCVQVLEDAQETQKALYALGKRYAPGETEERLAEEIEKSISRTTVVKLTIEHITGKEGIELAKMRKSAQ